MSLSHCDNHNRGKGWHAPVSGLVFCFNYDKSTVERFLIQIEFKVAIYASKIYTALYIMFLMRADSL
jgi:hypothetical protein